MKAAKKSGVGHDAAEQPVGAEESPASLEAKMRAFRKRLGGSGSDAFNDTVLRETLATIEDVATFA